MLTLEFIFLLGLTPFKRKHKQKEYVAIVGKMKQFYHTEILGVFFCSDLDHSFKVTFLSSQYEKSVILSEPTSKSSSGTVSRLLHQQSTQTQL